MRLRPPQDEWKIYVGGAGLAATIEWLCSSGTLIKMFDEAISNHSTAVPRRLARLSPASTLSALHESLAGANASGGLPCATGSRGPFPVAFRRMIEIVRWPSWSGRGEAPPVGLATLKDTRVPLGAAIVAVLALHACADAHRTSSGTRIATLSAGVHDIIRGDTSAGWVYHNRANKTRLWTFAKPWR